MTSIPRNERRPVLLNVLVRGYVKFAGTVVRALADNCLPDMNRQRSYDGGCLEVSVLVCDASLSACSKAGK